MALYPHDQTWNRAEVVSLGKDGGKVMVRFVDFGQELEVEAGCLSPDLAAKDVPVLVIPVQLDIRPNEGKWTQETLDNIHQLVEGKQLQFERRFFGNPFPLIVKMTFGDIDIQEILINDKYAKKGFRER